MVTVVIMPGTAATSIMVREIVMVVDNVVRVEVDILGIHMVEGEDGR